MNQIVKIGLFAAAAAVKTLQPADYPEGRYKAFENGKLVWKPGSRPRRTFSISSERWRAFYTSISTGDVEQVQEHVHFMNPEDFNSLANLPCDLPRTPFEEVAACGGLSTMEFLCNNYLPPADLLVEALFQLLRDGPLNNVSKEMIQYLTNKLTGAQLASMNVDGDLALVKFIKDHYGCDDFIEILNFFIMDMDGNDISLPDSNGEDVLEVLMMKFDFYSNDPVREKMKFVKAVDILTGKMTPHQIFEQNGVAFFDGDEMSLFVLSVQWLLDAGDSDLFELLLPRSTAYEVQHTIGGCQMEVAGVVDLLVGPNGQLYDPTAGIRLFSAIARSLANDREMNSEVIMILFRLILFTNTPWDREAFYTSSVSSTSNALQLNTLRQQRCLIIDRLTRHPNFTLTLGCDLITEIFQGNGIVPFDYDEVEEDDDKYFDQFTSVKVIISLLELECRSYARAILKLRSLIKDKDLPKEVWGRVIGNTHPIQITTLVRKHLPAIYRSDYHQQMDDALEISLHRLTAMCKRVGAM